MRPLFQEIIMPNVSYVGGSAVSYWLQLKSVFDIENTSSHISSQKFSYAYILEKQKSSK